MTETAKTPFNPRIEMLDGTPILIKNEMGDYESLERILKNPTRTRLVETLTNFSSYLEAIATRFDPKAATIYTNSYTRSSENHKYVNFEFKGVAHDCREGHEWRDDFVLNWIGQRTISARNWLENDEHPFSQEDFALFLDKHINDIASPKDANDVRLAGCPTQADLYNFVTTLEDSKGQKFLRKVNVQNGDVSVSLERESNDGTKQRLKLFERFAINLQLFEGFPIYQVTAKLRFRVKDGQVVFFYDIEGLEELFNLNRDWAVKKIKGYGFPVFI